MMAAKTNTRETSDYCWRFAVHAKVHRPRKAATKN
jgi:hypothetical protein